MTENKQLGIALGTPPVLLALSMFAWSTPVDVVESEASAVASANADFESSLGSLPALPPGQEPPEKAADQGSDVSETEKIENETSADSTAVRLAPQAATAEAEVISSLDESSLDDSLVRGDASSESAQNVVSSKEAAVKREDTAGLEIGQLNFVEYVSEDEENESVDQLTESVEDVDTAPVSEVDAEASQPARPSEETVAAELVIASTPLLVDVLTGPAVPPPPTLESQRRRPISNEAAPSQNRLEQISLADLDLSGSALSGVPTSDDLESHLDQAPPPQSPSSEDHQSEDDQIVANRQMVDLPQPEHPQVAPATSEVTVTTSTSTGDATPSRPFLGVGIRQPSSSIVTTLYPDSTAAKLGVMLGDELRTINGAPVVDIDAVRSAVASIAVGKEVLLDVKRDGKRVKLGPVSMGSK